MSDEILLHESAAAERLVRARLVVASDWTKSGTDYWTIALRRRRPDQEFGETVGTLDLSELSVEAGAAGVDLYADPAGLPMSEGEQLVAYREAVGDPAALVRARVILNMQRNA